VARGARRGVRARSVMRAASAALTLPLGERYYFFFFQAEDGIRDPLVTGVQTCALPISQPRDRRAEHRDVVQAEQNVRQHGASSRSEERRVGKECRYSRPRYREKKRNGSDRVRR